eukprot:CAMPEP_0183450068 /NCGR_PEP_ID=MMETSP0370-20130417/111590_1 /TAXON_ID=268820 /ORGANISM="Peridinium aciculiferum, Strain PAER-2" /LENGTH=83 /DNA_ID=CAMNT_0025641197 /DNA_START=167 /DNA_END=414 /DNA_ORIENTATION=-
MECEPRIQTPMQNIECETGETTLVLANLRSKSSGACLRTAATAENERHEQAEAEGKHASSILSAHRQETKVRWPRQCLSDAML